MQPEDEQGFTFVDKRQAVDAEAHPTPADEPPTSPAETADLDQEDQGPTGPMHRLTVLDRFLMSIDILHQGAWIGMGLVPDPATGTIERDLPGAHAAIDAVVFLADKVRDQLDDSTRRELTSLVDDLRLNYVRQANR